MLSLRHAELSWSVEMGMQKTLRLQLSCLTRQVFSQDRLMLATAASPGLITTSSLPAMRSTMLHMCCCCHAQVFSQDRLMLATAASPGLSRAMAGCLLPQMLRLTRREEILRLQLWSAGGTAGFGWQQGFDGQGFACGSSQVLGDEAAVRDGTQAGCCSRACSAE
jgi:hypothetical protein